MDELAAFLDRVLDVEARNVALWAARAPEYPDARRAVTRDLLVIAPNAPAGFPFSLPMLPPSFHALPVKEVTDVVRGMAERFQRRVALRRDDFDVPGLGRVAAFAVSHSEEPGRLSPDGRWTVGPSRAGLRIIRVEVACVRCLATGIVDGTPCTFVDEFSGARCTGGWIPRGGLELPPVPAISVTRLQRPENPRWHAWFDA